MDGKKSATALNILGYSGCSRKALRLVKHHQEQSKRAASVPTLVQTVNAPKLAQLPKTPYKNRSPTGPTLPRAATPLPKKRLIDSLPSDLSNKKQRHEMQQGRFHGMENLGNTCYMNAVLQILMSLKTFAADMQHPQLVRSSLPDDSVYRNLLRMFQEKQAAAGPKVLSPASLKQSITQHSSHFGGFLEEDAHEFLVDLLDQIQEDTALVHCTRSPDRRLRRISLSDSLCPTTQNFSCIVEHELVCQSCKESSTVTEWYRNLSIDIPEERLESGAMYDLLSLLKLYFQDEVVERTCEACGGNTCTVHRTISRLPRVLVLHMKRFSVKTNADGVQELCKKEDCVEVDRILDLGFCCSRTTRSPVTVKAHEGQRRSSFAQPQSGCDNHPVKHLSSASSGAMHEEGTLNDVTNLYNRVTMHNSPFSPLPAQSSFPRSVQDPGRGLESRGAVSSKGAAPMMDIGAPRRDHEKDADLEAAFLLSLQPASKGDLNEGQRGKDGSKDEMLLTQASHLAPTRTLEVIDRKDDLENDPKSEDSCRYYLHGIINHIGASASTGHFVADIYDPPTKQWMRHDDAVVSPIEESTIFGKGSSQGYMFVYVQDNIAEPQLRSQVTELLQLPHMSAAAHGSAPRSPGMTSIQTPSPLPVSMKRHYSVQSNHASPLDVSPFFSTWQPQQQDGPYMTYSRRHKTTIGS